MFVDSLTLRILALFCASLTLRGFAEDAHTSAKINSAVKARDTQTIGPMEEGRLRLLGEHLMSSHATELKVNSYFLTVRNGQKLRGVKRTKC